MIESYSCNYLLIFNYLLTHEVVWKVVGALNILYILFLNLSLSCKWNFSVAYKRQQYKEINEIGNLKTEA